MLATQDSPLYLYKGADANRPIEEGSTHSSVSTRVLSNLLSGRLTVIPIPFWKFCGRYIVSQKHKSQKIKRIYK